MDHHRRLCVAQLLPREILYLILEAVISLDPPRLLQAHLSREQTAGKPEWRSLPYICRSWYVPAQSVLYKSIRLHTLKETRGLHHSLEDYPHLRLLIKRLHLPTRVNARFPPSIYPLFRSIIQLVNNLQELTTHALISMDESSGFPISSNQHRDLSSLSLHGTNALESPFFLEYIGQFRNLRHLTLASFSETADISVAPILERLDTITFKACPLLSILDDWLCAQPRLTTLRMHESSPISPAPRLLTTTKITRMEMMYCLGWKWSRDALSEWFTACSSVRSLRISEELLLHHWDLLPTNLHELTIEFVRFWVSTDEWTQYLSQKPKIDRLVFVSHRTIAWYMALGQAFADVAAEHGLTLEYQFPNCDCMEFYDKLHEEGDNLSSQKGMNDDELAVHLWETAQESIIQSR